MQTRSCITDTLLQQHIFQYVEIKWKPKMKPRWYCICNGVDGLFLKLHVTFRVMSVPHLHAFLYLTVTYPKWIQDLHFISIRMKPAILFSKGYSMFKQRKNPAFICMRALNDWKWSTLIPAHVLRCLNKSSLSEICLKSSPKWFQLQHK